MTGIEIFLLVLGLYILTCFMNLFAINLVYKSSGDPMEPGQRLLAFLGPILLIAFVVLQMIDHTEYRSQDEAEKRRTGRK